MIRYIFDKETGDIKRQTPKYNPAMRTEVDAQTGDVLIVQDPRYIVCRELVEPQPSYDPATERLKSTTTVDAELALVIRGWEIESRPPEPPEARWQDFQLALLTDPVIHDMMMIAKDAYPGLISAWATGLGQAATGGGYESLLNQWALARLLPVPASLERAGEPLVNEAIAAHMASLAAASDLPADFVSGLS